jgi:predicted transposase YbfD/YdcC
LVSALRRGGLQIVDKNADYMLALKGNQGTLKDDVELYFEEIDEKNVSAI